MAELARARAFPLVFAGLSGASGVHVSALRGHLTGSLVGLHVEPHRGLGGRSMIEQAPRMTADYGTSRVITHDYDREVLAEGVRTLLAVPVIVDGVVRGVIYGARRDRNLVGGVAIEPAVRAAARLQRELAARDSAEQRRLQLDEHEARKAAGADTGMAPAQLEHLRTSYAELRALRSAVGDPEIAARLETIERRLTELVRPAGPAEEGIVPLSPRELDVLGYAAVGLRNAEIAEELGLTESTVKSYLGAAMQKLSQRSRHGAVAQARRLGLLP